MAKRICKLSWCDEPHMALGFCNGHYLRYRDGRPLEPPIKKIRFYTGCSFPGCDRPFSCNELCAGHNEQRKNRKPLTPIEFRMPKGFHAHWIRMLTTSEVQPIRCVRWIGSRNKVNGHSADVYKVGRPSAAVCKALHGPKTKGQIALHLCGRGHEACVNPHHLRWGTTKENMRQRDIHAAGRAKIHHHHQRLIHASTEPTDTLAERWDVDPIVIMYLRGGPLQLGRSDLVPAA